MGRINAGTLTETILLSIPGPTVSDGRGGRMPGPATTPVSRSAHKRELSGTEVLRLGQTLGTRVVEFTIRYLPTVTTSSTLTWQGKTLAVRQLIHDDYKEFTVLTCVDNGRD